MVKPLIFDHPSLENFRRRAFLQLKPGADFLLRAVGDDLSERLLALSRHFDVALDLHGHTGIGAEILRRWGRVKMIERAETSTLYKKRRQEHDGEDVFHVMGREALSLRSHSYDLILSLLSLHITHDIAGAFAKIRAALKPDGLFLGVLLGAGTLQELRETLLEADLASTGGGYPRVYPFADMRDIAALLQRAGFAMPVVDVETITVRYDNLYDLMADLRAQGMQNALTERSRRPVSRRFFKKAAEIYAMRFSDVDGRIRARFSFVWFSGWAPDPSQQKPMKPGSAQMSLAEALEKNQI